MKEKLKNLSFPALLLLVVAIFNIRGLFFSIINLFRGYWGVFSIFYFIDLLCPIALFYFLGLKDTSKKSLGLPLVIFGGISLLIGVMDVRSLFVTEEFIDAVVGGPLYNVVSSVLIGVVLLLLGLRFIKGMEVTKSYYVLCGFGIFLIAYTSVFMAIANPFAIISKLPTFFYILSLWYIPKLYDESQKEKTRVTSKKVTTIALVVIAMYAILGLAGGLSGTGGSSRGDIARDPNGFLGYSDSFWDWYYENSWTK